MKKITCLGLALCGVACGAPDETVLRDDGLPPGVIRIDGDVDRDHIFYDAEHRESYCESFPESPACSEIGTSEQPWLSAEYHGLDDNDSDIPCYAADSDRGACLFPSQKRLKFVFNTANCTPTLNDALHDPPSATQASRMILGTQQGFLRWHGISAGVSVEDNACSSGTCMTVAVSCGNLEGPLAVGGLSGSLATVHSNLPPGPHGGVDQGAARTINGGTVTMDVGRILGWFKSECDSTPSLAQLRTITLYTALHEMGHVFGFNHFDEGPDNVMFPFVGCDDTASPVIATPFANALGTFTPSGGGSATILDHNLETLGP